MHLNTRVIFTLYTIYGTLFKGECCVHERVSSVYGVRAREQCQKVAGARGDHAAPGGMMLPSLLAGFLLSFWRALVRAGSRDTRCIPRAWMEN